MDLRKTIDALCTPSYAYFMISMFFIVIGVLQNLGSKDGFCLGNVKCNNLSALGVLATNVLYIAFWTWALNALCKAGWKKLAWGIFLLPALLFFLGVVGVSVIAAETA